MDGNASTIERELRRWPGVNTAPGRFGAVAFRYGEREIGHLHGDRIADLPVTPEMREDLLAKGRIVSWGIDTDTFIPNGRSVDRGETQ